MLTMRFIALGTTEPCKKNCSVKAGEGGWVESPRARAHPKIRHRPPALPKGTGIAVQPRGPGCRVWNFPPPSCTHLQWGLASTHPLPMPMPHRRDDAARRIDAVNPQPQHCQLRNLEHHRIERVRA